MLNKFRRRSTQAEPSSPSSPGRFFNISEDDAPPEESAPILRGSNPEPRTSQLHTHALGSSARAP